MKFLHTSDWHLGRSLFGRKRYEEFSAFLEWLAETMKKETIDTLLVAGDVFDTSTPSNRAQELYYKFLCRVAGSNCRHVIITAGNHDSPSFLSAPRELLRVMNVHVIGSVTENPEDEVITLYRDEQPEAIICAVPYLRDRDIRTVEPGETIDDKNTKLVEGVKNHYTTVCERAEKIKSDFEKNGYPDIPIVTMGHLFTAGGKTVDGDGVRELYVGSLAHVEESVFPSVIDYLALGHLHVPQKVGNNQHIRYSGSPLPMGFGESKQEKKVLSVDFEGNKPTVKEIPVPCFQQLEHIEGSIDSIREKMEQLKKDGSRAWLEIDYTGNDSITNLRELLNDAIGDSALEIRRIKNRRVIDRVLSAVNEHETLDDLDKRDVFARCLDAYAVPVEEREELTASYNEIIRSLEEEDVNAE